VSEEAETQEPVSGAYLAYTFIAGIGLIVVLTYGGYASWPLFPTIAAGALAQSVFRVIKRMWKRSLSSPGEPAQDLNISTAEATRYFVFLYVAMVLVSLLWYGIGWSIGWLVK